MIEKETYSSIAELKGKRMGVLMGTTYDNYLAKNHRIKVRMKMKEIK